MTLHQRRLKIVTFTLDGNSFECQVQSWKLDPGVKDGNRLYSYCPDGISIEETDNEPSLELKFYSDWRSAGVSTYLWQNSNSTVAFVLDHHPDIVGEHVRWSGSVLIKPPPAGGDVRDTEMSEITLQIVGDPTFEQVG